MADEIENNLIEEEDDGIITLTSEEGDIDFYEIASISYDGCDYEIMQPVELFEGMEEDEALVFKVSEDDEGDVKYEIEQDEDVIAAVFAEYDKLVDEAEDN